MGATFMSMRILFFATDLEERETVRTVLCVTEAGWEKSLVSTFDEAVAALQDLSWDAVVVDYQPGRSARQKFSTLSAVHIANAFAHEMHGSPDSNGRAMKRRRM